MAWKTEKRKDQKGGIKNLSSDDELGGIKDAYDEIKKSDNADINTLSYLIDGIRDIQSDLINAKIIEAFSALEINSTKDMVDHHEEFIRSANERYLSFKLAGLISGIFLAIVTPLIIYIYNADKSEVEKQISALQADIAKLPNEDRVRLLMRDSMALSKPANVKSSP